MPEITAVARKKLVRHDGMTTPPIAKASFVELGVATPFSFLRGASDAIELVLCALELGMDAIGIADRKIVRVGKRTELAGFRAREVTALGGLTMYVGVQVMGTDPMVFLTRVTAPVIFGTIIVLNMLQNSLFAKMTQPLKGVMNTGAALVIGVGLANLYGALSPFVTGPLPSGGPGYEYEIWLANALLSVTFPLLIFYAAYFSYWPLVNAPAAAGREAART